MSSFVLILALLSIQSCESIQQHLILGSTGISIYCPYAEETATFFHSDGRTFGDYDVVNGDFRIPKIGPEHNGPIFCSSKTTGREPVLVSNFTVVGKFVKNYRTPY